MNNNRISPEISLIIPIYEVEKYIENTINSVLNQTFREFEVVLVDNNTKDRSMEIAENMLAKNNIDFQSVRQPKQGLAATRNKGFDVANGDWVISIDSDDIISPRFLEELYYYAINNNLYFVTTKYAYINDKHALFDFPEENIEGAYYSISSKQAMNDYLLRKLPIMITNTIFKKSFLTDNKLRLDENMQFGADLAFIWRTLLKVNRIGVINKSLYNYYNRPDSLMTAPSMEKIDSRINGFFRLKKEITPIVGVKYAKLIFYREILGLLATSSQFGKYGYFKKVYDKYFTSEMFKSLISFPDKRIFIQILLLKISPKLYNNINRFIRRNKKISNKLTHKRFDNK